MISMETNPFALEMGTLPGERPKERDLVTGQIEAFKTKVNSIAKHKGDLERQEIWASEAKRRRLEEVRAKRSRIPISRRA